MDRTATEEMIQQNIEIKVYGRIPPEFQAELRHIPKPQATQDLLRKMRDNVLQKKSYLQIDTNNLQRSLQQEAALLGQLHLLDWILEGGFTPDKTGQMVPSILVEDPNFIKTTS